MRISPKNTWVLLLLILMGCDQKGNDSKLAIEGTWAGISAIINGSPLPEEMVGELRLTLTEDRFKTHEGNEVLFDSTYHLDTSNNPTHINMLGNEGELTGKDAQGILELEGDQLSLCYTMPSGDRPAAFQSNPGSQTFFIVWQRQ